MNWKQEIERVYKLGHGFNDKEIESEYRKYTTARRNRSVRIGAYLCLLCWAAFVICSLLFELQKLGVAAVLSTIWFALPVVGVIVLSKRPQQEIAARNLAILTNVVTGLITVLFTGLMNTDVTLMVAIVMVLIFFMEFVSFAPQPLGTLAALLYFVPCLLVVISVSWMGKPANFQAATVLAVPSWFFGVVGSLHMEHLERESFLLHRRLTSANQTLKLQSRTDPLTDLTSRRGFMEYMEERILKAERDRVPFVLAVADIDHFKRINDTFGHPVGDSVLKAFAALLRQSIRATDMVARYGGEEFVLILETHDLALAFETLDRFREELSRHPLPPLDAPITCSIGASLFQPGCSSEDLIKLADDKLYDAKRTGRNQVLV